MRTIVLLIVSLLTFSTVFSQQLKPTAVINSSSNEVISKSIEALYKKLGKAIDDQFQTMQQNTQSEIGVNKLQATRLSEELKVLQRKVKGEVEKAYKLQQTRSGGNEFNMALIRLAATIDEVKNVLLQTAVNRRQLKHLNAEIRYLEDEKIGMKADLQKQKPRSLEFILQLPEKETSVALQKIEFDQLKVLSDKINSLERKYNHSSTAVPPR